MRARGPRIGLLLAAGWLGAVEPESRLAIEAGAQHATWQEAGGDTWEAPALSLDLRWRHQRDQLWLQTVYLAEAAGFAGGEDGFGGGEQTVRGAEGRLGLGLHHSFNNSARMTGTLGLRGRWFDLDATGSAEREDETVNAWFATVAAEIVAPIYFDWDLGLRGEAGPLVESDREGSDSRRGRFTRLDLAVTWTPEWPRRWRFGIRWEEQDLDGDDFRRAGLFAGHEWRSF